MSAARLLGHVLLWIGFLCGAFVTVRQTEVAADPWSTISWPAYGLSLALAVAGIIQLRRTKKTAADGATTHAQNVDQLAILLQRIHQQICAWQQHSETLDVYRVHHDIEEKLSDDLAAFADRRESLIDTFGLEQYVHIMTEFALAERTINRMWSASADGYIDEVKACLTRAAAHLEAAMERLDAARALPTNS